jgi:L-aminopeptidase/D-esterase-like protein
MQMRKITFANIDGIRVGHAHNLDGITGCSVVICEEGASAGVDVRGGSPGTRETDLLDPVNNVEKINAVLLSGGSAFGLDAASGVMQYLEEKNIGFDVEVTKVPIVCSAVLFDLKIGRFNVRPDKAMGYEACKNSEHTEEDLQGNIGAGIGATVGKIKGPTYAMKGGLGAHAVQVGDLQVGAMVAVNCLGDVVDPTTGEIIAGVLKDDVKTLASTEEIMISHSDNTRSPFSGNTTIGVVVTNAVLTKAQAKKIASMAHNGYGRTLRPAHSMFDGDTIFTMATGKVKAEINVIGILAARVMEQAVLNAVKNADSLDGYLSFKDLLREYE